MGRAKGRKTILVGETKVSAKVAYDLVEGFKGECELYKKKNENLKSALSRAIEVIKSECDDQELINDLTKILNQ